jgi:hypothetical protein
MDFNLSLTEGQLKHAFTNAARFFAEPISTSLRDKVVPGNYGILEVLHRTTFHVVSTNPMLNEAHPSMAKFLFFVQPIFSTVFLAEIDAQAQAFEKIAGIHGLTDVFIGSRPTTESINDLIRAIAIHCANEAVEAGQPSQQAQKPEDPPKMEHAKPSPSSSKLLPPPTATALPDTSSSLDAECPLVQLELEGATILEAWNLNETTRELEHIALSTGPSTTPSFMEFKALPVYHGTDFFRDAAWEVRETALRTGALEGQIRENQVVPTSTRLPVIWTGFSPLRCFLWAAFHAEVLTPIPTGLAKHNLESAWPCGAHTHTGVTLFKFRPTLPAPFGLTSYVLPKGREEDWDTIRARILRERQLPSTSMNRDAAVKYIWDMFLSIHGGETNSWPHAFHCREHGPQLQMLLPWTTQLWRTVWFDEGIEALNASHEVTYVISFKEAAPNLVVPEKQKGKLRDK